MIGALWTGISGLASHQTALDNESHNIANVNTVGYKASRISFADQMYQDRIGKGSKVLDSEKLYVQGNLKLTGVDYDMALSGNGFFTVKNTATNGTSESLYTRAGNFRMGDNGTLQDAAGNEVQGWAMTKIDPDKDITSTNPNIDMFTSDYTKLLGSKIIRHSNYIETITAKATDYTESAKSDAETVFEGAGAKSQSAKISDVEALISNYSKWLSALKDEPDGGSSSSTAQISQINFKSWSDGLISTDGDQIYVYIDGNKYSQNYVSTTSDASFHEDYYNSLTAGERTALGLTTDPNVTPLVSPTHDTQIAVYDREASRIATYKALADTISEIPGLRAYMVSETNTATGNNDVLEEDDTFDLSTAVADMRKGILQIESLIPGESFTISEVGESSGQTTVAGSTQTSISAVEGTGVGALESAKDALSRAITGKQQDVYTATDLDFATSTDFEYSVSIYSKDLERTIPVPNDSATIPQADPITIDATPVGNETNVDAFVRSFNTQAALSDPVLADHVIALNINGNVVIQTLDENYDVDFSGGLTQDPAGTPTPIDKNNDYSGRQGAGAEFIELVNKIEQTATQDSLQLKLDTLGISDSAFGEFSVDSDGVISMTQDGVEFAIGQVSIALFNNNRGLNPSGDNLLASTTESGDPIYNLNNEKTAKIEGQTLELSTADLSESLVNLMVFQRAFEANAKSITTSDELLNTLINLKR